MEVHSHISFHPSVSAMSSRPRTSSGTLHHLKTIPSIVDFSSVDAQNPEHRSSLSHSASTTSTMSRDGGSTGHSTPQEEAVDSNAKDSVSAQEQNKSAPPQKKKKGQRFFCTDFPPCNLSFTRSEHLARHIRYVMSTCCSPFILVTSPCLSFRFVMSIVCLQPLTLMIVQKTHGRTPLPMSLHQTLFSSG